MKGTIYSNSTDYLGNYKISYDAIDNQTKKNLKKIFNNQFPNNKATILGDDGNFYVFNIKKSRLSDSIYVVLGDRVEFTVNKNNQIFKAENINILFDPISNKKENIIKKNRYLTKNSFLFYLTTIWAAILLSLIFSMENSNNKQIPTFIYTIISFIMTSIYSLVPRRKKTHLTDSLFNLIFPISTNSISFIVYYVNNKSTVSIFFVIFSFILIILGFVLKYLSDYSSLKKSRMSLGYKK